MEAKELQQQLEAIKSGLEKSQGEKLKAAISEMQAALDSKSDDKIKAAVESNLKTINEGLKEISDWKSAKSEADIANQKALDALLVKVNEISRNTNPAKTKSFGEAFSETMNEEKHKEMVDTLKSGKRFILDLKAVGNMTLSNNLLSGDSVATYSSRQALLPSQKINFRDLMRTVNSDTGLYVHYRESAGEGSISSQTEGSAKSQIDFDFTEVKTVNSFIAGFARVSRQILRSLPYLQATLPALLLREFFVAENAAFFTTVTGAASGSTATVESDDVKQLMDYITNQRAAKFNPSFVLISHKGLNKLNKALYTNGYYQGSGGVVSYPNGSVQISGVNVIAADWVTDDKVLIVDQDYLERIEVDGLKVEFFEQDSDNVQKNLITARVECWEAVNLMLPASAIYADMGNASF